jgi:hypothetical protein
MTNTKVQDLLRLAGESLGTRRDPRSQRMLVVALALARRLGSQSVNRAPLRPFGLPAALK